jgi:hypothetical protein
MLKWIALITLSMIATTIKNKTNKFLHICINNIIISNIAIDKVLAGELLFKK